MKRHVWIRLAASVALGLALVLLGITPLLWIDAAYAQVPPSGTFSATRSCAAPRAINGLNPGGVRVSNGQRYEAIGFNSEEQKFIQIKVPGANPERRWVSVSCGTFVEATDIGSEPSPDTPIASDTELLPFFDDVDNPEIHKVPQNQPADITPQPPVLNNFDKAVLETCGAIGTRVKASDFKQLMSENPDVLRKIKDALGGQLRPVRTTDAEFLDDLTSVWFESRGFEHIFCGEIKGPEEIGGLHFIGRYLQLQNEGIGGRLPNNLLNEEVDPGVIYTLGVVIKQGDENVTDTVKGYDYVSNAEELLLNATKAVKAQGNVRGGCLFTVDDKETGKSFKARLFKGQRAIDTFYPDATPVDKPTTDRPCGSQARN